MATILADDVDPGATPAPAPSDMRLVISASALGTVFEWYDFFIYGTLAASASGRSARCCSAISAIGWGASTRSW